MATERAKVGYRLSMTLPEGRGAQTVGRAVNTAARSKQLSGAVKGAASEIFLGIQDRR